MFGPTEHTETTTTKRCNGCDALCSTDLKSERIPKLNRTVHYCTHPGIEEKWDTDCLFIARHKVGGKAVKTPKWCLALSTQGE